MGSKSHFIPLPRHEIKERLFSRPELEPYIAEGLGNLCKMLEALDHHSSLEELDELKILYSSMDPDGETRPLDLSNADQFIEKFESILSDGNWEDITDDELQLAMEEESLFPISMDVRFDEFARMKLYKLGLDETSDYYPNLLDKILRRPGKKVNFQMYNRVIQLIQFNDSDWFKKHGQRKYDPGELGEGLHLRLFKNVPASDLEIIFPNTKPKMRVADKAQISLPLIIGFFMLSQQYLLPLLLGGPTSNFSSAILIAIISALGSYAMKAYMTYRKTKEKYMTAVAKDLYFKGQANNQAVLNMVIDLAEEQEVKESLLCYTFLLTEGDKNHTISSLDNRIEDWLGEQGVSADFEIVDAVSDLAEMGLIELSDDILDKAGNLNLDIPLGSAAIPIHESLARLDDIWDNLYDFEH